MSGSGFAVILEINDVIRHILHFLPLNDIFSSALWCKKIHKMVSSDQEFWWMTVRRMWSELSVVTRADIDWKALALIMTFRKKEQIEVFFSNCSTKVRSFFFSFLVFFPFFFFFCSYFFDSSSFIAVFFLFYEENLFSSFIRRYWFIV
jgi:hypothetical protein